MNHLSNDLNAFAYLVNWPEQLDALAAMAMPEPWDFLTPPPTAIQRKYYILDRYLRVIFRKRIGEYNWESDPIRQDRCFAVLKNHALLNTGLLTPAYQPIYMLFEKTNGRPGVLQSWMFKDFVTGENRHLLRFDVLPERPLFTAPPLSMQFIPEWPIRLSERLLKPEYRMLYPEWLRSKPVLPLYLEASIDMSRYEAEQSPSIAVHQYVNGGIQWLLPLYLDDLDTPDAAVALSVHDTCYVAQMIVPLHTAYCSARALGRPSAMWLRNLVE